MNSCNGQLSKRISHLTDSPRDSKCQSTCSVCLDIIESKDYSVTKCGHKFHTSCLLQWARTGKTSCPLCRGCMFDEDDVNGDNDNDDNEVNDEQNIPNAYSDNVSLILNPEILDTPVNSLNFTSPPPRLMRADVLRANSSGLGDLHRRHLGMTEQQYFAYIFAIRTRLLRRGDIIE